MTAPAITARATPVGTMLDEGYQALICFAADPDVSLWEKTVQPHGMSNGDPIDITTQHNLSVRTKAPRALNEITDGQMTVAYDPAVEPQIMALLGTKTTVIEFYPDGSQCAYFGYLGSFERSEMDHGTQPEATCMIIATNVDPVSGDEEPPVWISSGGTGDA